VSDVIGTVELPSVNEDPSAPSRPRLSGDSGVDSATLTDDYVSVQSQSGNIVR
jgi:hypothetical protein